MGPRRPKLLVRMQMAQARVLGLEYPTPLRREPCSEARQKAEMQFFGLSLGRVQGWLTGILSDRHIFTSLVKVTFLKTSFHLAC